MSNLFVGESINTNRINCLGEEKQLMVESFEMNTNRIVSPGNEREEEIQTEETN